MNVGSKKAVILKPQNLMNVFILAVFNLSNPMKHSLTDYLMAFLLVALILLGIYIQGGHCGLSDLELYRIAAEPFNLKP